MTVKLYSELCIELITGNTKGIMCNYIFVERKSI